MKSDFRKWYAGKKVLITGGLGFLGSNLAHALVESGAKVTIVDALLEPYGGNIFNVDEIRDRLQIEMADIRDTTAMKKIIPGHDLMFNLAAQVSHVDSMTEPLNDYDINVRGNLNVLEIVRRENPALKIVYGGTRGQYGKLKQFPVNESAPRFPVDIYGVNRDAGERFHMMYANLYGLKVTSIRINNTYGPRHQMKHGKYGILNWFTRLAMDNETIKVFGDGKQLRDYNYVDDVTDAFLMTGASEEADGESFNLGSGNAVRFIDTVKKIIEIVGSGKYELIPWPKERKEVEVGDYFADYGKIQKKLGWEPEVRFEDGLKATVDFYGKYRGKYW